MDHADIQFEVYAGFPINDPEPLCMSQSNFYTEPTIEAGTCGAGRHGYVYDPCAGAFTAHAPSPFVQADVRDFYGGKSNCNRAHGDLDGNHVVNAQDQPRFTMWHNPLPPIGQTQAPAVPVHLGVANPDHAWTK